MDDLAEAARTGRRGAAADGGEQARSGRRSVAADGGEQPRSGRRSAVAGGDEQADVFGAFGESGASRSSGDAGWSGEPAESAAGSGSRKRRRTPRSDWQFPVLTEWGLRPEQQRLIVIIATVIGVVAGATGLVATVGSLGDYAPEREANAAVLGPDAALPMAYQGWSSPKLFASLADRAKDSKELTEKEVFGQSELAVSKKLTLKLAAKRLDADCSAALWGTTLLEKVSDAGCLQAARGLYVSSDGRYVGQYTLLNLKDGQSAGELVESLKTLYRGGWARPLTSSKAAFPAGGYSEGGGYALGHYVGLVWLGKTDGLDPTAKDDFVSVTLALRGAEKSVYRRVVAITGPAS
ncbi:hypothetical protein [Nonomuraea sp. NPDC052265]|uniref:hypothetical protein n=1 Tax=Nonomuraea sp. NPDC052265 TaxID=3364374 RepID=UPI0037C8D284